MGKNKRIQFKVFDTRTKEDVFVDSKEEVLVYRWLLGARELGVVRVFSYQPCTFVLSEKATYRSGKKEKTLFQDHVYSPDFLIEWDPSRK